MTTTRRPPPGVAGTTIDGIGALFGISEMLFELVGLILRALFRLIWWVLVQAHHGERWAWRKIQARRARGRT